MKIINTKQKAYRYAGKTFVDVRIEVEMEQWDKLSSLKDRIALTVPWMADHLCQFGDYDYSYNISLWVDSLTALGRGLLRWNNVVGSQRNGRRALTAAAMLKRAYNYESWEDKAYLNWSARSKHLHIPINAKGNVVLKKYAKYYQLKTIQTYDNAMGMNREEYADKMWKIIHDRQKITEAQMKIDAWAYIQKHLCSWWD